MADARSVANARDPQPPRFVLLGELIAPELQDTAKWSLMARADDHEAKHSLEVFPGHCVTRSQSSGHTAIDDIRTRSGASVSGDQLSTTVRVISFTPVQ